MKLLTSSSEHNNNLLYFEASLAESLPFVEPCISPGIIVWKYKLAIEPIDSPWYRDQGGKSKSINLKIRLVNYNDDLVRPPRNQRIPLQLSLWFDNGEMVQDQNILSIFNKEDKFIGVDGEAILQIRINDISMHHHKKLFVVEISPDSETRFYHEIQSIRSNPIEVMTKPKNKQQNESDSLLHSHQNVNNLGIDGETVPLSTDINQKPWKRKKLTNDNQG